MYIIVVGGGKVGYYLTKTLLDDRFEVLLIERSPERAEVISEDLGAVVITGDGAEAAMLDEAGAARADLVIAVTGEDEDNLVICQMAKQKFHVPRTIARVNNPKNETLFKLLGVDVTVSQTSFVLSLIEQSIPEHSFVHLLTLGHQDIAIVDAKIGPGSVVANHQIEELAVPENCIIAAVVRGNELIIPSRSTVLLPGDDVIAIAHKEQEEDLRSLLC